MSESFAFGTPDLRIVAEGLRYPEGPVALPDGNLLVVEIARGTLTRIAPDGRAVVLAQPGGGPNGLALGADGHAYVCNNGGFAWLEDAHGLRPFGQAAGYSGGRIERVDLESGAVEVLYEACDGRPLCGPNDLVFDGHGGFWFTDLGKVRTYDWDRGSVYYARQDGSRIERVIHPLITPNGIGLAADGKTLYVAETQTGRLWQFAVSAPGRLDLRPWPSPNGGTLLAGLAGLQLLDSLALDAQGNICIGTLMNGGISVVSADGSQVRHLPLPDLMTSNICFGGADLRTAFITLSCTGCVASMTWPYPGLRLHHQSVAGTPQ